MVNSCQCQNTGQQNSRSISLKKKFIQLKELWQPWLKLEKREKNSEIKSVLQTLKIRIVSIQITNKNVLFDRIGRSSYKAWAMLDLL